MRDSKTAGRLVEPNSGPYQDGNTEDPKRRRVLRETLLHLHALEFGLSSERQRLAAARSDRERELRAVWIAQREREIRREREFLGLTEDPLPEMTDDELLSSLLS